MDERLENIETKLAYQEQAIQQLSDEIYDQRQQMESLAKTCARLADRVAALETTDGADLTAEEPPPHY